MKLYQLSSNIKTKITRTLSLSLMQNTSYWRRMKLCLKIWMRK